MTSNISWLDASADEQRRAQEIVRLFSQQDSQDELGGRRIVVAISDLLFPGTSVLHSRARYLLFIPWFAKISASKKDPAGWFEWLERQMIRSFLDDDSVPGEDRLIGLVGREAGPKVKQLPSSAYWSALDAWQILTVPGSIRDTLVRTSHRSGTGPDEAADELAVRSVSVWHAGVGDPPAGFPESSLSGGFRLTPDEAAWIKERWLATADGSLLAHLVREQVPLTAAWAPWEEPACLTASPEILAVLDDAERFSLANAGARWLYQLLVAERYQDRGFDRVTVDLDEIRTNLQAWVEEVRHHRSRFDGWTSKRLWTAVRLQNAHVDPITSLFFDVWFGRMGRDELDGIADDADLRNGVMARERSLKKGQARLANDKLLANWRGPNYSRVTFRWGQVHQLVSDVIEGLAADAGA